MRRVEYIEKEQGSYQLHLIKTKNYKTITVRIYFREPIKKEFVTRRNFLNDMLFLASKKYPNKKVLSEALQNLYAASINYKTRRLGTYLDTCYTLKVLKDKYTEDGNFEKSVELLCSLLLEPKVENDSFLEEEFTTIYEEMKAELETVKENKEQYAIFQLLEHLSESGEVRINGVGYMEDLETITKENLYHYYQEYLKHALVDIYVLGDIDEEEVGLIFKKYFTLTTFKPRKHPSFTKVENRKSVKVYHEDYKSQQSALALACKVDNLTPYERNYPLTLYNIILGGGSNSYLFQEVREKANLAYYISSSPSKLDNLILIQSGVTVGKEKEAIKIIEKQIKRLAKKDLWR